MSYQYHNAQSGGYNGASPYNQSNASNINNASPYGSGDPYYNESTGFIAPPAAKKTGRSPWIKFGIPIAILVIIGAVVGAVVAVQSNKKSKGSASSTGSSDGPKNADEASSIKNAIGVYATATNSQYMLPIYPSATNAAAFTKPTFVASKDAKFAWPQDSFKPSTPSPLTVRQDRPRLIAPSYKWDALPNLIKSDPYLAKWNETIYGNATEYYQLPVVKYFMDGDSGILDNAREIKMRVKAFAYMYRMSKDTKWVDRTMRELTNAVSSDFGPEGTDKWNPTHFLDVAEFVAAYGIAYDWLHDILTEDQKTQIRDSMITYGLNLGVIAFSNSDNRFTGWWSTNTQGNWNCVCNGGLTLGSLAILGDDQTGTAEQLLGLTIDNAKQNCAQAVSTDGTWSETPHYWYFGTTGWAEMVSALQTATGSDYGLSTVNPDFAKTGLFHMYATGPGSLFAYGDHGPNKFSTTANAMLLIGDQLNHPEYVLFQRDQADAAEPWSMFWYNPTVSGAFWNGMPLDATFAAESDQWMAMRSSWTDQKALYIAMKAGTNQGHQTHNDLDAGDFVLDAMGTRWAGELGSGDYRSKDYFSNDSQESVRWLYYRKASEGQNVIVVNSQNQLVGDKPQIMQSLTTGEKQGSPTVYTSPQDSTALLTVDISSAYDGVTSYKRGIRMINGRKQVLLQDDITSSGDIEWRMHTNATVEVDGTSATLKIDDKTMIMTILNPPEGVQLSSGPTTRMPNGPALQEGLSDQENAGVSVVKINLPAGQYNLQVLFSPQWEGMSANDFVTPKLVAIDQWGLTSH